MDEQLLIEFTNQMREDYQIPPFVIDETIHRYLNEGYHRLGKLKPSCSIADDEMFKSLLKNYVFYAYNHRVDDFLTNYEREILTWQMEDFYD